MVNEKEWLEEFDKRFCEETDFFWENKKVLAIKNGVTPNEIKNFISQALQKRDEEWVEKIRNYQNGWVIMHDRGEDNPPEPEFAPEYGVIEELISTLNTK